MEEVSFYNSVDDILLKFAVIIAKNKGNWVFCKHREYSLIQPKLIEEARNRGFL